MELIPIKETFEENETLTNSPLCSEIVRMTIDFYKKIGFLTPWIGYLAKQNGRMVGSAGFKGQPVNGTVEIAYGTFEQYRQQGVGTEICKRLVRLTLETDASLKITARTILPNNYSTRILEKNNFKCIGVVTDLEDGEVWEWVFAK